MTNLRQSLIKAISDLDLCAVEKFMDDNVPHFQAEKHIAVKYLKEYFEWVAIEKGIMSFKIIDSVCTKCYYDDDNEILHQNVVIWQLPAGYMSIDLKPTQNGKFQMDYCQSCEVVEKETDESTIRFAIDIPFDLLDNFKPDELYLRLLTEKENMLAEIDNGNYVFWFVEDLKTWLKKHAWAIRKFDNFGYGSFAFRTLIVIVQRLGFLHDSLIAEKECMKANDEYDKLNDNDIWELYEWYEKYRIQKYASTYLDVLNLDHLDEGYFRFKEFLPNLRFAVYGHSEFLKFLQNMELAYEATEEIRKDTLLEDIEDEWHWEEWGKGIHFEFDDDSSED
jgi:hypothetical protein